LICRPSFDILRPYCIDPVQQAVLKIGKYLIILAVVLVAIIITVGYFRGEPMLYAKAPHDPVLLFALILTVAAIPVCQGYKARP